MKKNFTLDDLISLLGQSGSDMPQTLARLEARPQVLEEAQVDNLRMHLRQYSSVPYGAMALKEAGIKPNDARRADLGRLKPLTKRVLAERFSDLNIFRMRLSEAEGLIETSIGDGVTEWEQVRVVSTSGSQGRRTVVLTTPRQLIKNHRHDLAVIMRAAEEFGLLQRLPVRVVTVGSDGYQHVSTMLSRLSSQLPLVEHTGLPASLTDDKLIEQAEPLEPDLLVGYGSRIGVLIDAAYHGYLGWKRPIVFGGAEPVHPRAVHAANELGWPIYEAYGCTEFGNIAVGRAGDLRVLPSEIILEPIDSHGDPVEEGTWGSSVLVTKLTGGIQPLVRYLLDDEVRLVDLGEALPRLEIRGRTQPVWRWPSGVTIEVRALRHLCDAHFVAGLVAHQEKTGLHIAVSPAPSHVIDLASLRSAIAAALTDVGLANPDVTVEFRESLRGADQAKLLQRWVPDGNDDA